MGCRDTFTSVGVEGKIRIVIFILRKIMKPSCVSACSLEEEVMTKYGDQGTRIYCRCSEYFSKLPLASIIAGSVYTIHGGLFRRMPIAPINFYFYI
ncbi:unnamed protein product, partial [Vitis vinifera]